jgi:hypothetical protein
MEMRDQLHAPAALPQGKESRYSLGGPQIWPGPFAVFSNRDRLCGFYVEALLSLTSLQRHSQVKRACSVEDIDFVVTCYVITFDLVPQSEDWPYCR